MKKRMFLMLVTVAALIGVLGAVKLKQVKAAIAQQASFQPPPEAVTTILARQERWPATLNAIGSVAAVRGVSVAADLPGVVESIAFDSGMAVKEGDVLVRLDTRQERAQLAAAESQRDLARLNLDRARGLVSQGIVAQADLDRASAEHLQAEARVGEIRATIERLYGKEGLAEAPRVFKTKSNQADDRKESSRKTAGPCWRRSFQAGGSASFTAWKRNAVQGKSPSSSTGMKNQKGLNLPCTFVRYRSKCSWMK